MTMTSLDLAVNGEVRAWIRGHDRQTRRQQLSRQINPLVKQSANYDSLAHLHEQNRYSRLAARKIWLRRGHV
ncbi:hypothetical protein AXK12_04190 [Cephaloticoccus capnophilus]|uniref:Uncharacterized protein n=1 Tax=Cephaloticoccus capnophilus TaxID=1548208 RepID=A0A139SNF8_9BACT|nr:hypothetical protein [Cephaloticoccus capnophilus]KXU36030.1 hypothetical protein AXK12_04190 [Cephaloticoccus capnophilus]